MQLFKFSLCLAIMICTSCAAQAQTASLRGKVFDQSGALVPQATVTIAGPDGPPKTATTTNDGSYSFSGLTVGQYRIQAKAPNLEQSPVSITLRQGLQILRLELKLAATQQELTVHENAGTVLSTESANNASSLVLKGKDLEAVADDPEDLATDLQALAGPAAGPGGGSVYIDGFSGGQLPPKDAIRETIHLPMHSSSERKHSTKQDFSSTARTFSAWPRTWPPKLDVLNSFIGGGARVGNSLNSLNGYEFQNYTTVTRSKHTVHFGVRVRAATIDNNSPINFGGTFTFAGGTASELDAQDQPVLNASGQPILESISSIESYRRTLLFDQITLLPENGNAYFVWFLQNPTREANSHLMVFGRSSS